MTLRSSGFALALALSQAFAWNVHADGAKKYLCNLDAGSGGVTFDAIGRPSALKIHGKGEAPKGQLHIGADQKVSGSITFKLETLETGISMRDKHMKEKYLEVEKFPQTKLTITDLTVPAEFQKSGFSQELPFKGTLALHGVEKPVEGKAQVNHKDDSVVVDAKFTIKTTDFAIARPSFAGITMAEDVNVETQVTAPLQAE